MNPLEISHKDVVEVTPGLAASLFDDCYLKACSTDRSPYTERRYHFGPVIVRELKGEGDGAYGFTVGEGKSDTVNLVMMISGSLAMNHQRGQRVITLQSGRHRYYYAPREKQEWRAEGQIHLVHIAAAREHFLHLLGSGEGCPLDMRQGLCGEGHYYGPEGRVCSRMLQAINDMFSTPLTGVLKRIFVEAKLYELIALQLHHANERYVEDYPVKKKDRELLAAVHQYLANHFGEDHSLRSLSKTYGLNEFTLKKGFKSLYGMTVFDYLFELKMNHARRLLLDEDKLVCEVARAVGYRNPNHFSTAFKKKFGVSPLSCRIPAR